MYWRELWRFHSLTSFDMLIKFFLSFFFLISFTDYERSFENSWASCPPSPHAMRIYLYHIVNQNTHKRVKKPEKDEQYGNKNVGNYLILRKPFSLQEWIPPSNISLRLCLNLNPEFKSFTDERLHIL